MILSFITVWTTIIFIHLQIKLKNKDLDGSGPTYTDRVVLEFKGHKFAIHSEGYTVFVNDEQVWFNG